MKPLAIFGGTFDPVHLGHLSVAWEASELLDAEVRLMPASVPPHRPRADRFGSAACCDAARRAAGTVTSDAGYPRAGRSGPSYTIDTLIELRAEQGERPLVLLLGADAFAGLPSWHRWRELFEVAHIGVLSRPGVEAELPHELQQMIADRACRRCRRVASYAAAS
jgi:nicotinate-nucleotide adenylyltransferase